MALNNSVTLQEYDATLRASVNAYYEHAINDPNMSRDEAIQSTAQMAESYHNAVDEFQASMEAENLANETANEVGNEAGETIGPDGQSGLDGPEGGLDADDGGIE